ncbi:MAG: hypothetical protein ACYSWP_07415 [Planctomycetota bacterium]|jgi:hypothetical protein
MGTSDISPWTWDRVKVQSFGEFEQTDDQVVPLGSFTKITCDGVERSEIRPTGSASVWNTTTSEGTFIAGGVYEISIALTITATANNTSVTLRLQNTAVPADFLDVELFIERSATPLTYQDTFNLISEGSSFEIQLNPEAQVTVNNVRIFEERKY